MYIFLLLQLEPQKYSIYREEAVDAISMAMDRSLTDERVRTSCCRALLILGRCTLVSSIVQIQTGSEILKEVGCNYSYFTEDADEGAAQDKSILLVRILA